MAVCAAGDGACLEIYMLQGQEKRGYSDGIQYQRIIRTGRSECNSEEAKRIVILHKEWLGMTWREYTVKAHQAMANMYISDERFKLYYDKDIPGCAKLLEQSIRFWVDKI